jgi:hypothetical protein
MVKSAYRWIWSKQAGRWMFKHHRDLPCYLLGIGAMQSPRINSPFKAITFVRYSTQRPGKSIMQFKFPVVNILLERQLIFVLANKKRYLPDHQAIIKFIYLSPSSYHNHHSRTGIENK